MNWKLVNKSTNQNKFAAKVLKKQTKQRLKTNERLEIWKSQELFNEKICKSRKKKEKSFKINRMFGECVENACIIRFIFLFIIFKEKEREKTRLCIFSLRKCVKSSIWVSNGVWNWCWMLDLISVTIIRIWYVGWFICDCEHEFFFLSQFLCVCVCVCFIKLAMQTYFECVCPPVCYIRKVLCYLLR